MGDFFLNWRRPETETCEKDAKYGFLLPETSDLTGLISNDKCITFALYIDFKITKSLCFYLSPNSDF